MSRDGEINKSYIGTRPDILAVVPPTARKILDIGCSTGTLGAAIKHLRPEVEIHGIELDPAVAETAAEQLNVVHNINMDEISLGDLYAEDDFDCIIMADVLEHLKDPWSVVQEAALLCRPGGALIACLPNVRHIDTLYNLVIRGRWPYRERGIHDRTHLRFFARENVLELFLGASLNAEIVTTHYRLLERPAAINKFAKYLALPGVRGFLAYQYIIVASKS